MKFQLGRKKVEEIEELIDTNCWKAFVWIHILLQQQLYHIYFFGIQKKPLGYVKHSWVSPDGKSGSMGFGIRSRDKDEHGEKWKIMEDALSRFSSLADACYSSSLIEKDLYQDLKKYNTFRNKKVGHPNINEYLVQDEEVKKNCKQGLKIVKELDNVCNKTLDMLPQTTEKN